MSLKSVLEEIANERQAQEEKWGEQNHPSLDQVLLNRKGSCDVARMADEYEMPTENRAKQLIKFAVDKNELTWGHIALEEFAEVVACLKDEKEMRGELIQLAAVAVAWVECLDRKSDGTG